jgi:hypothetical protein
LLLRTAEEIQWCFWSIFPTFSGEERFETRKKEHGSEQWSVN